MEKMAEPRDAVETATEEKAAESSDESVILPEIDTSGFTEEDEDLIVRNLEEQHEEMGLFGDP